MWFKYAQPDSVLMPVWWNWKYTWRLERHAFEACRFESCYRYVEIIGYILAGILAVWAIYLIIMILFFDDEDDDNEPPSSGGGTYGIPATTSVAAVVAVTAAII